MKLTERINRIITLGLFDRLNTPMQHSMESHIVAAGNPGKYQAVSVFEYPLPPEIDCDGKLYSTSETRTYTVSGSSMSPEGVFNGDELIVVPTEVSDIKQGDYIVIEVDKEYFLHKHHVEPIFQYKLRKALVPVPSCQNTDETEKQLLKELIKIYEELSLDKYKKDLSVDLRDALQFYGNSPIFASITYKEGRIHYSFHPQSAIKYRVVRIVRKTRKSVELMRPDTSLN